MFDIGFDKYADADARGWFQSTAFVILDYIVHGDNNAYRDKLPGFVGGMADGKSGPDLVQATFPGKPISDLEKALAVHREAIKQGLTTRAEVRGLCPLGFVVPADKAPVDPATATDEEIKNGAMPISSKRAIAPGASLQCIVLST